MTETRQPVAIRIARPYPSEDAFLEHELETLTRTSVVLVGAHARPQGVVLRFEVTLATGAPLLRGEGRVVGYKTNAFGDEPGLTLRFTRLDPRSKALVDRAAAMREARGRGSLRSPALQQLSPPVSQPPAAPSAPPPRPAPLPAADSFAPAAAPRTSLRPPAAISLDEALGTAPAHPSVPPVARSILAPRTSPQPPAPSSQAPPATSRPPLSHAPNGNRADFESPRPPAVPQPPREPYPPAASAPALPQFHDEPRRGPATLGRHVGVPERAALLERLRARARNLPAARLVEILSQGARPR